MATTKQNGHTQPALSIIDLSKFTRSDPKRCLQIGQQMVQVCHDIGFCYLSGHGIPEPVIDEAFEWTKKFHDMPIEVKERLKPPTGTNTFLGWHQEGTSTVDHKTPDFSAQYNYGNDADPSDHNIWPSEDDLPGFRAWAQRFYMQAWSVQDKVLRALALGLGLEEDFLLRIHDPDVSQQVVLKHYPPAPVEDVRSGAVNRLGVHTDSSDITLLLQQEQGGLEVESKGGFIYVDAVPGTFVLNIGDIFQLWSGHYLKSTRHRIKLPKQLAVNGTRDTVSGNAHKDHNSHQRGQQRMTPPRYSIPIFAKPSWDAVLEPMPGYEHDGWKRQTFREFHDQMLAQVLIKDKKDDN